MSLCEKSGNAVKRKKYIVQEDDDFEKVESDLLMLESLDDIGKFPFQSNAAY